MEAGIIDRIIVKNSLHSNTIIGCQYPKCEIILDTEGMQVIVMLVKYAYECKMNAVRLGYECISFNLLGTAT